MLTEEETREHALTYTNDTNRIAQNNVQIQIFLEKSLTDEGHVKIVQEADRYLANGMSILTLYFNILMSNAVVDARDTASHLRENLTSIDS